MSGISSSEVPPPFVELDSGGVGFQATLVDGPCIDLIALAGIEPTDEEYDALISCDWQETVMESGGDIIETLELDEMPGQSDVYFDVEIDDRALFVERLRAFYLNVLKNR